MAANDRVREWRHKRAEARKAAGVWGRKPTPNSSRTDGLRKCSQCHQDQPESEFYKSRDSKKEWFSSYCKTCCRQRAAERTKTHPKPEMQKIRYKCKRAGTTADWFVAQLRKQNGKCAICGTAETHLTKRKTGTVRSLAIDHDHETGVVRGLLCFRCNTSVHLLDKHGLQWAEKAVRYMETSRKKD